MIIWGKDHEARADALARTYGEKSLSLAKLPQSSDGIVPVACEDATLSVWGHGGAETFSDLFDVQFGTMISNWKKKNASLKTVEIITCDARHNSDFLQNYANRVAHFVVRTYNDVVIKALPIGAHKDDKSILWANTATSTFCYITAPGDVTFDHANQRLKAISPTVGSDLGVVANEMAKERTLTPPGNFSTTGGSFGHLRDVLGIIAL